MVCYSVSKIMLTFMYFMLAFSVERLGSYTSLKLVFDKSCVCNNMQCLLMVNNNEHFIVKSV